MNRIMLIDGEILYNALHVSEDSFNISSVALETSDIKEKATID